MKELKQQLKKGELSNLYLFFGEENFLKDLYKKRIKFKLLGSDDDVMNYNYYEGKQVQVDDIIEMAETLPFLGEHRLIIIENSELFKSGKKNETDTMAEYLDNLPSTTYIIFVEDNVDKRNKLYKLIKKIGNPVEFKEVSEYEIKQWISLTAKKNNIIISSDVSDYFIQVVGTDMKTVEKEFEKLISYSINEKEIKKDAIDNICSNLLENKIFDMIDAIGEKRQEIALKLYHDLLTLKEPPFRILFMLVRQFRMLLQVKTLSNKRLNSFNISKKLQLRKFIVDSCLKQIKNFNEDKLKKALFDCLEYETLVKTGRMEDKLAIEMIIIKYSR
ncbi:MAG: DNA polymerase III subunit delta [Eubacteriales bacterium]